MRPSFHEVESFLNDGDALRPQRREHHLPPEAYSDPAAAFHITKCARRHGQPFTNPRLAAMIVEAIQMRRERQVWRVYAYCLMPDHLHLVVQLRAPEGAATTPVSLLRVMEGFSSFTTRQAWQYGLHGKLWQHDQYDRFIRTDREFSQQCQYVLNNPVRRGLVEDWTLWPYSGILDDW
jgi:REP element-mobilizing transposase RayT